MNCSDWEERIALSASGDLSPALEAEVKQHLAECAGCREFAREMEDSLKLLRSAHEEPIAAGHYAAVRARVLARWSAGESMAAVGVGAGLAAGLAVRGCFVAMRPQEKPKVLVAAVLRLEAPAVPLQQAEPVAPRAAEQRRRPRRT